MLLAWWRYHDSAGVDLVGDELKRAFPPELPLAVRAARYADIKSLQDDAAAGDLDPADDCFDPVARDPDLWELRWTFEDGSVWRMYHAEPAEAPGYLLALAFHEKDVAGSPAEIKARQDAWIDTAARRYIDGRPWQWGLP